MTEFGREPTAEEIAEVTGLEPEEVEAIKRSARAPISLEKPVGDDEQSEFGQFIADEQAESPYERAVEILRNDALRDALENLGYRERRVLELRYGLDGQHPRTLDEIGRTFNVTRERVRQIQTQSLEKLKKLREAQELRDDTEIASSFALRMLGDQTQTTVEVVPDLRAGRDANEIGPPLSPENRLGLAVSLCALRFLG